MPVVEPFTKDAAGRYWLNPDVIEVESDSELRDFDVIVWNGDYYEPQGRRPSDGWWWCEPCATTRPGDLTDTQVYEGLAVRKV